MATESVFPNGDVSLGSWYGYVGSYAWDDIDNGVSSPSAAGIREDGDGTAAKFDCTAPDLENGCCYRIRVGVHCDVNDAVHNNLTINIYDGASQIGSGKTIDPNYGSSQTEWTSYWTGLDKTEGDLADFRVEVVAPSDSKSYRVFEIEVEMDYVKSAISRSPTSLTPSCVEGEDATDDTFDVWDSQTTCNPEAMDWSISDDVAWLSCSPSSGDSSGEHDTVTVSYSTSGLAAGEHTATITITSTNANNSPQTIDVTLTVTAASAIGEVNDTARANISEINDVALANIGEINDTA